MRMSRVALLAVVAGAAGVAGAQSVTYTAPTFDRWNYPFNSQGGASTGALVFGVLGTLGQGQFDDRDGQFLASWITAGDIAPGLATGQYEILSARVTATIDPGFGNAFVHDPTPDSWRTYLDPNDPDFVPDSDPGRPIELFGTGFRNGFTAFSFNENGPFALASPTLEGVRNAYARGMDGLDASNNVRDRVEAASIVAGIAPVAPGVVVPGGSTIAFDLPVGEAAVQAYLAQGLQSGILSFTVSSLHEGAFAGPATFPVFMTKESLVPGATPATLELSVRIVPAPGAGVALAMGVAGMMRRRR